MSKIIKSYIYITVLLTAFVLMSCPAFAIGSAEHSGRLVNRILASIEGEPLTYEDLKAYLKIIGKGDIDVLALPQTELAEIVHDLVSSRLIEKEAESLRLSVANEEITAYVREVMALNGLTEEKFTEVLQSRGLNMPLYKEQVRRDIYRNKITMMVIRNSINVSDEDVDRYLEEHPAEAPEKGQVGVEQLYYAFSPEMSDGEKSEVSKWTGRILERAKGLPDGLRQADEANYSDLGYVSPGDLKEELRSAVDKLNSGEISDLIEADEGVYILRVTAKSDDPTKDAAFRAKVREVIFNEKYPQRVEKYFNEDLPKKYFIELKV